MQEREFLNLGEMLGMGFDSLQEKLCPNSAIDTSKNEEQLQKMQAQDMFDFKYIKDQKKLLSFSFYSLLRLLIIAVEKKQKKIKRKS